jgi:MFS family permease
MARAQHSGDLPPAGHEAASAAPPPAQSHRNGHARPAGGDAAPGPGAAPAAQATPRARVPSRSRLGFRSVLRNKQFLRLWMAQLISQTIMNAANYGIIILIATASKSVTATGGAIAAFSLPAALFGAPAGVYVDHMDKRRVLWMSNALRALASFGFVVTLFLNQHALVPVYALVFFMSLVGQFFAPAEGAAIPLLVHEDELVNALALFNITFTLSQAAGLILLGPLIITLVPNQTLVIFGQPITMLAVQSLFIIIGVLYIVCALLTASIPHRMLINRVTNERSRLHVHMRNGEQFRGIWAGITEVWAFIRRDHTLFAAVLQLSLAGTVIAVIAEIAPRFVTVFFSLPEKYAALVFIPAGAGLIVGSALLPQIMKRVRHRWRLVAAGILALSGSAILLTFVHSVATHLRPNTWPHSPWYFAGILLISIVMGFGLDLVNIPAQTTMQELSPDWIKGRVLALQGMLFNAATVPVLFLIGLTADYFQLPPAMDLLALLIFAAGFGTLLYGRQARRRPLVVTRTSQPVDRPAAHPHPHASDAASQNGHRTAQDGHNHSGMQD